MAFYLSPMVDVNEIDLTNTIPAVATSIGVIILRNTWKGPEMKPIFISNVDSLINVFGRPTNNDNPLADVPSGTGTFCNQDILSAVGFLRYSSALYATRVMPEAATFAGTKAVSGSEVEFNGFTAGNAYKLSSFTDTGDPDEFHDETGLKPTDSPFTLIASSRGGWGNNIRVAVVDYNSYQSINLSSGHSTADTVNAIKAIDSPLLDEKDFLIIVQARSQVDVLNDDDDTVWSTVEVWNVSTDVNRSDDMGGKKFAEYAINESSKYIRISVSESQKNESINIFTDKWQEFSGGTNGGAGENDTVNDSDIIKALDLYANAEEIDVNIFIDSNNSDTVKNHMVEICETRKDCMVVLDCKRTNVVNNVGNETESLRVYRRNTLNLNTSYAAFYGNWIEVYDKWNGRYRWIPASGYVAGIYANTDDVSEPWMAPAGLNRAILQNVRRLAWNPTKGERDILYKNGINPVVSFSGQGKVIWGQKTLLDKESAFNRVNVRRLFIILEKAISTAAKYFLFEPNTEFTRTLLINMIDPFLRDVRSRQGIYDFMIVCDNSNNTPERIDRNELWCDIYIKPTRAAEFIVLNFIATKTGASFTELIAAE
jgi:hypothetical protein